MSGTDWLLALHVLSAAVLVGALTALWALVLATRPAAPVISGGSATRVGRVWGPLVGVGMGGTIVFGVWLALVDDAYELWDGWIVAALVLWAFAAWTGARGGSEFERDPVGARSAGIRYQTLSSLAVLVTLVLMIWKPGA